MNMQPSSSTLSRLTPALTALGLLAALACSEAPLHDLGYTSNELTDSNQPPPEPELPPVAEFAREFAGVWIGSAEDPLALQSNADSAPPLYRFPSGSTRIRLELSVGDGELFPSGTITFGDAAPPPLATDPDVGYPIEADTVSADVGADGSVRPPVEGFSYDLTPTIIQRDLAASGIDEFDVFTQGNAIDGKLELSYLPTQVFASWCALQTEASCPINAQLEHYDDGSCFVGEERTPIDCLKASQCLGEVCQCEGDFCTFSIQRLSGITIRFSENGLVGLGDGTFVNERGFQQPLGTLHFEREASAPAQQ